jgi:hypothetical protein
VLDQPTLDAAPTSGLKSPIEKGLGGAIAALLASFLVIVMRTPGGRDTWDEELADPTQAPPAGVPAAPVADPATAATYMAATAPPAPAEAMTPAPAAPMTAAEPNGRSSSSHALRRHGLMVTRKSVTPQQRDSTTEGGLA